MLPKIDVPIYELNLLSSGKKVRFRPFLVKEQKLLLMATQSEDSKDILNVVKQISKNCLIDDVDVESLPIFDLEYIFLNLRARSVNEVVNLQYKCNNKIKTEDGEEDVCGSLEKFDINLLEILPEKNSNHNKKIMLTDNLGLMMKYPTFEVLANIDNQNENEVLMELLINCIEYIFDKKEIYYVKDCTKEELMEFIDNLQQKDLEKIQQFFETSPKIKKNLDFKCRKCGYKENIVLEGLQNFFA
jgi:DNA-directed RNA polymerase subunit M/transcription elongation factor TFIIS